MDNIQEEIDKIISKRYGNYKGRLMQKHKFVHEGLKYVMGDKLFLAYLKDQENTNPRPEYKLPESVRIALENVQTK